MSLASSILDLQLLRRGLDPETNLYKSFTAEEMRLRELLSRTPEHQAAQAEWRKRARGRTAIRPRTLGTPHGGGVPCA